MEKIVVSRIRPVSWKIFVQGKDEAEYVRQVFHGLEMETTQPAEVPGLVEPALYAFVVTPKAESPMTTEEIEAVLEQDRAIALGFGG